MTKKDKGILIRLILCKGDCDKIECDECPFSRTSKLDCLKCFSFSDAIVLEQAKLLLAHYDPAALFEVLL